MANEKTNGNSIALTVTEEGRKNSVNTKVEEIIEFLQSSIVSSKEIPSVDDVPFTLEYIPVDVIDALKNRYKEK